MKALSPERARRIYDRIGSLQDSQAFYEDRGTGLLLRHGRFPDARRVFEFGCGTGRLAHRLLSRELPPGAIYRAVDLSPRMVRLASKRLAPFGPRARVSLSEGGPPAGEPTASCDRFLSTYVLDLLPGEEITAVLREAHRMLEPGGLLCLAALSTGSTAASRLVARLWTSLHHVNPALVAGCRPLELLRWLSAYEWRIRTCERIAPFGVPLEVVVAERT